MKNLITEIENFKHIPAKKRKEIVTKFERIRDNRQPESNFNHDDSIPIDRMLLRSFIWDHTEEGQDYWERIYELLLL